MEGPYSGIWLVVGLPLLGFLIQALLGKKIIQALGQDFGKIVMGVLAVSPVVAAFTIAVDITFRFARSQADHGEVLTLFNWIQLQSVNIPFEFRVDTLSMTMVLIVTGVGSLIHIYATAYMAEDKDFTRFFTYMNLFIAFMLVLVLGNNLALLFIGWEGVGLCSYLLIGFWYKEKANSLAANKAFIVNRIGDFGLTLGMFVFVVVLAGNREFFGITDGRWLSYDVILRPEVLQSFANTYPGLATLGALLLFVGAMGKSAQFPLYIWLPDAMAGPTPVSALIHAATMVTSGVYLLNRMGDFFLLSPTALAVVAAVGALTALLGAAIAFGQTDIKKVLAYSTVSQLGYMFIACGVGAFYAGLFHVLTHAFFKALLFMGAGAVIAAMAHNQDMRVYGNLRKYMPATYLTMGVAFLAIAGVPYLFSGFWSKEAILAPAVNDAKTPVLANLGDYTLTIGGAAGWIGFIVAFMTAAYMTRMMVLTFGTKEERWRDLAPHHEDHGHHPEAAAIAKGDPGYRYIEADQHGFFYTDEEFQQIKAAQKEEHHHDLEPDHRPREVSPIMWAPLVILAILSLGFVGAYLYGDHRFEHWLFPAHEAKEGGYGPIGTAVLIALSFITSLGGIAYGLYKYNQRLPENEGFDLSKWNPLRLSAQNQFGIDNLFTDGSIKAGGGLGNFTAFVVDNKIVDGIVNFIGVLHRGIGRLLSNIQTGYVRSYALVMQIAVVAFLGVIVYLIFTLGGGN